MSQTSKLIHTITEGIQEKKGQKTIIADLRQIGDTICTHFIICQGNSPNQVSAITEEIREYVRKHTGEKPIAIEGLRNSEWVAMDYSDVMVHIFLPETRTYYDLEHLWEDAELEEIPDLD